MTFPCVWCGQALTFCATYDAPNGRQAWRHPDGSTIVQTVRRRCGDPRCNDLDHLEVIDDHVALPNRSGE